MFISNYNKRTCTAASYGRRRKSANIKGLAAVPGNQYSAVSPGEVTGVSSSILLRNKVWLADRQSPSGTKNLLHAQDGQGTEKAACTDQGLKSQGA